MDWISTKDKMPEADVRVLVYDSLQNEITIGEAPVGDDDLWGIVEDFNSLNRFPSNVSFFITHWMPLPKNP